MNSSLMNQMILIFGLIAVGYIANKTGILNEAANRCFSSFLLKIALPSTIVNSAIGQGNANRSQVLLAVLAAVGVFTLIPLISWGIASIFHWDATWQLMLDYSNLGFMGFPLIRSLYGEENMFYAAIFMMVFNIHIFTVGVLILKSGSKRDETDRVEENKYGKFLNPGIISSLLAFVILIFQIPVPDSLAGIVSSLGAVTTPLALVVIGSQLALVDLVKCLTRWELYIMCFLKLILYPMVVYMLLMVLVGPGLVTSIATILVGLPVAGNVTMLCSEYGGDVSLAAQGTGIAILISGITIPAMLSLIG